MKLYVEMNVTVPNGDTCNHCVYFNDEDAISKWCILFSERLEKEVEVSLNGIRRTNILKCKSCKNAKVVRK